jgi:hypothetical protein
LCHHSLIHQLGVNIWSLFHWILIRKMIYTK